MSAEIKTIVAGIVTAVEACTPSTDTGAPARFKNLARGLRLEDAGRDRFFAVRFTGGNRESYTKAGGIKRAHVDVTLRVAYHNEARSETDFYSIVADDTARLQDYVPEHMRQNLANVKNVYTYLDSSVSGTDEQRRIIVSIPLRIEYTAEHITP